MFGEGNGDLAAVVRPYGVGIDCHSKFIAVCVLRQQGSEIRRVEREFGTAWHELRTARLWVLRAVGGAIEAGGDAVAFPKASIIEPVQPAALRNDGPATQVSSTEPRPEGRLRYVIESTACYHFPVIHAFGGRPCIVNPMLAGPYRRKTDKLDARTLAYHGISGLWPESFWVDFDRLEFRALVLRRRQLIRERTRVAHAVNTLVLRWGHTIGAYGGVLDSKNRSLIEDLCRKTLVERSPYFSPHALPDTISAAVLRLFERYDALTREIREQEKTLKRRCAEMVWETQDAEMPGDHMLAILTSVPGVGPVTAAVWLAEIVTPRRFAGQSQVAAYIGCDPSVKVSAGKVTSHSRRKGNGVIHTALVQVAQMLVAHRREALGEWGYRLSCKHAKGGWQKAISAVARRVGLSLYHVHRTGEFFSYEKYALGIPVAAVTDEPLRATDFSTRVFRILSTAEIQTVRQLLAAVDGTLLKSRGVGPVARKEIMSWYEALRRAHPSGFKPCPTPPTRPAGSSSAVGSSPARNGPSKTKMGAPTASAAPTASSPASTLPSSTTGVPGLPCPSERTLKISASSPGRLPASRGRKSGSVSPTTRPSKAAASQETIGGPHHDRRKRAKQG
jgi:transposase